MGSFETCSDAELLAGTAQDPAAFGAWYRRHERDVLGFFRYATRSSELAADLTAETFAAALESIGGYRPELGEARAWLVGIARHVLARSLARGRVENRARAALALPVLVVDDEAIERIEAISAANGTTAALLATINTGDGYRTDPRTTWISAPGCYAFQVSGLGFSELIVFQALPYRRITGGR